MNPWTFAFSLLICIALDTSFLSVISIGQVHPLSTATLVVFVSLFAPRPVALWASLAAGLLLDLVTPAVFGGDRMFYLPGPYALGFVFGTQLVLLLRSMVFRRNPFAVGLLTTPFLFAVSLAYMALWSIRGVYPDTSVPWAGDPAIDELIRRLGIAAYSGAFGIPMGWLLLFTWPIWRFDLTALRR